MYKLVYSKRFAKTLKNLDRKTAERILSSLERLRFRPEAFAKRLVGKPLYSLRVGDHRIILDIKKDKLIVLVLQVAHRKNIYKKLGKGLIQYHLNETKRPVR